MKKALILPISTCGLQQKQTNKPHVFSASRAARQKFQTHPIQEKHDHLSNSSPFSSPLPIGVEIYGRLQCIWTEDQCQCHCREGARKSSLNKCHTNVNYPWLENPNNPKQKQTSTPEITFTSRRRVWANQTNQPAQWGPNKGATPEGTSRKQARQLLTRKWREHHSFSRVPAHKSSAQQCHKTPKTPFPPEKKKGEKITSNKRSYKISKWRLPRGISSVLAHGDHHHSANLWDTSSKPNRLPRVGSWETESWPTFLTR